MAFCWTRLVKWSVFRSLHFLRILAFWHWLWWLRTSPQPYAALQIFPVLFRAYHTDCLISDTPSWHLWGNSLDAPLSSGPDTYNFLLDACCWYGRHYGSSLHPLFLLPSISIFADGSKRRANRFVLHPTPEGPFYERSFSCMMQIFTARHFMAQPVFPLYELETFPVVVAIRAWLNFFTGKVVFHYLDSVASRSDFILQVLRPPWVLLWLQIMWILNTNAVSLLGLQELPAAATQQTNHPARFFSDLATWYRKVCVCPANFLHGSRELQTTATRRLNLQGWASKHPGLGKQAKSKACRVGPARALVAVGNHRVLWHLASNHFVSTFDNDGIMAHPTHQR